jgi:glycosyltransferase involved in cell wall biosynthesis
MKNYIPAWVKYILWFVFKAPQRKYHSLSLMLDIKGWAWYYYRKRVPVKQLEKISICTGLHNRTNQYLQHVLASIRKADNKQLIELCIFDCGTPDIDELKKELDAIGISYQLRSQTLTFTRASTFNKAVELASSNIVFLCDADISLPHNIVHLCNQFTGKKRAWFPVVFFLFEQKPAIANNDNGTWEFYSGHGMVACLKSDFEQIGKLNEAYTTWGGEDNDLWKRMYEHQFTIIRNKQPNLFHHWHASLNPKYTHLNKHS